MLLALSGTITKDVGAHWQLRLEWSGDQSVSGNYTNVTAKLYWVATDGYGAVYSSDTKTCSITINGSSDSKSAAGMAKLSGNQKKLIHTFTKRINHDADGTADVTLDAWFDAEVTLGGTFYDRIDLDAKTYSLNRIPRASSLTSSASWTAGNNFSITISRASSSFTHTVKIYVNGTLIKTISNVGSSTSSNFSTSENTSIFNQLNGASSKDTKIELTTYSGGDNIGTKTYTGTVTAPSATTVSSVNGFGDNNRNVYIDQSISIGLNRKNSAFTHTVEISCGSFKKTFTGVGTSVSWTPSSGEQQSMYAQTPNSNSIDGNIKVTTYYNGKIVRSATDNDVNFYVRNSNPTFSSSAISYKDTNSTTTGITGNNQYIIQNKSTLSVTIAAAQKATAINGATMSYYSATVNGVTKTASYSSSADVTINFGTVNATSNVTLTVKAVDSRGNSTSVTKQITIIPYSPPTVLVSVNRVNSFENDTKLSIAGSISPLNINGINKNSIVSATYKYKKTSDSTFGSASNFSITGFPNYSSSQVTLTLDNLQSWDVQVVVTDKLSSTTITETVPVGRPIFFIDTGKRAIGFNDFPANANEFRVNGRIVFGADMWAVDSSQGEGGSGALFLNNSDITGINGIWFNDKADNDGEGLHFLKSTGTPGSADWNQYDIFRILDGVIYLNSKPIYTVTTQVLWSGVAYPTASQQIAPSKPLSECPNGWILVWSDYDPGVGANDYNWVYTYVPKYHGINYSGQGVYFEIASARTQYTRKYIYIYNDHIVGSDDNDDSDIWANDVCLRRVLMY